MRKDPLFTIMINQIAYTRVNSLKRTKIKYKIHYLMAVFLIISQKELNWDRRLFFSGKVMREKTRRSDKKG